MARKPSTPANAEPVNNTQMSTFEQAAVTFNHSSGKRLLKASYATDALNLAESELVTFVKPTEILVSRWFPGYRTTDLSGKSADEGIGQLLGESLTDQDALESFRRVLSTPDIIASALRKLLPRSAIPVKRGAYLVSEAMVGKAAAEALEAAGVSGVAVTAAIAHVLVRVLTHMELVQPGREQKIIATASSFALSTGDLRRVILTEALRDVFSESRIAEATRSLDASATPELIAESISRMLRHASHSIREVKLRLEQLETVEHLIYLFYSSPASLTTEMQASANLAALANFANFIAFAQDRVMPPYAMGATADLKEACANVLTLLQSAPSIEAMPLNKFADYFGVVPGSSADGLYRGAVVYKASTQVSKMEVADVMPRPDGAEIALVPGEYTPLAAISSELNRSLLTSTAMEGLANLVADEISQAPFSVGDPPRLVSIGLTAEDLLYLAMAKADIVAFTAPGKFGPGIVYGAMVSERWMMNLAASTPYLAFFDDAASVVVYTSGGNVVLPSALPARSQSIGLSMSSDTFYRGDVAPHLFEGIETTFNVTIPIQNPGDAAGSTSLPLKINILSLLIGQNDQSLPLGGSYYAAVKEPGVDCDIEMMLTIASHYMQQGDEIVSDRAKSWLVEVLSTAVTHPAVVRIASRALSSAILEAKLDARRLAPQFKELMMKAYFVTLLATLSRFGKIPPNLVQSILADAPISGLSIKAALTLASMPLRLTATSLK